MSREKGMEVTREILQNLGDQLVTCDVLAFCKDALKQHPWQPGKPLIIDGMRHVEVLDCLSDLLAPAKGYLIYINVDRTTQIKRLRADPLAHEKMLEELEQHPTERQVRSKLSDQAALVLDGTQDPEASARKVIELLASKIQNSEEQHTTDEAVR